MDTHDHGLQRDLLIIVDGLLLVGQVGVAKASDVHQVAEVQGQGDGQQACGGFLGWGQHLSPPLSLGRVGGTRQPPFLYLFDLPQLLHGHVEQLGCRHLHEIGVEDTHALRVSVPDQWWLFPKPFANLPGDTTAHLHPWRGGRVG